MTSDAIHEANAEQPKASDTVSTLISASRISVAKNVPANGALYTPASPAAAVTATSVRVSRGPR